eukprot:TRINITY_DN11564_c0_g1_i10.p1 TRINITY_DN11564_c0_g1~~TRINITY_DN11564_c0_g1_i10.p1  ORF type:complete len:441 (+),score=95.23 TRINITY_DN11564_c0_g1_i10:175-1497(+)
MPALSISHFFILSPRGDSIINQNFRHDTATNAPEIFFRKAKFWKGEAPPIFLNDGLTYVNLKRNGLWFVLVSNRNISPSFGVELLNRMCSVIKDYCGILNEEAIRKNFILIIELLGEIIDFGYVQGLSTELLKTYVFSEPMMVEQSSKMPSFNLKDNKTISSSAVQKPISLSERKSTKNEIFVDIIEDLNVTFQPDGRVANMEIDGRIQMKSYLSGNPDLVVGLNQDLAIGKAGNLYGSVVMDDCNFHECVNLSEFEYDRVLQFNPPDGEFVVMNYRITKEIVPPFRIQPFMEDAGPGRVDLIIKVRCELPDSNYAGNVTVKCPMPKSILGCTCDLGAGVTGQQTDYSQSTKLLTWTIKRFEGGQEQFLRAHMSLPPQAMQAPERTRKEMGPITMNFEVPMFNASGLNIRFLKITERSKSYNPHRWVRYVTRSSSYVCRL